MRGVGVESMKFVKQEKAKQKILIRLVPRIELEGTVISTYCSSQLLRHYIVATSIFHTEITTC